jgi:meso-butanediol dehydrogenase/(S,S)-butanediol dehydrogenase/diacetyl reductase
MDGRMNDCLDMMIGAPSELIEAFKSGSPFKRMGTIADIGDAVALIASESARWISGQAINVDGLFAK